MKIVLVNTQTPGGAYVACQRLYNALKKQGVDVSFVAIKATKWSFLWERFCIWVANRFSRKNLFAVSIANTGTDISKLPEVCEADIIHLHWINQGGLSLHNIQQIQALGKPIVWTMHDMWPFTGICHHAYECLAYEKQCGRCPQASNILAKQVYENKRRVWHKMHFVGCSRWITALAEKSGLKLDNMVCSIPNPIDTELFCPITKQEAKMELGLDDKKKYVLFGAMNTTAPMKGFQYLLEADKLLHDENIQYLVVGKNSATLINQLAHEGIDLGYVTDERQKALIYNAADVFITPSLAENLPNMIMEAMACGTPCVGFKIGGIPEMIDHQINGYVAKYKNAEDLARGIEWVLSAKNDLNKEARQKVMNAYSEEVVANQYIALYQSILKEAF